MGNKTDKAKIISWISGLFLLLCLSIIVCVMTGAVKLPFDVTWKIILNHLPFANLSETWTGSQETIVWDLRLPRVILALVVGAMLSVAGVAFQGVLRNPLADPYILGVSVGAALGAASSILFLSNATILGKFSIPIFSFIGGIVSLLFVLRLSKHNGQHETETLILAGVVAQSLIGAFLSFLVAISGEQMNQIVFWMMGSLANRSWSDILILLPYFLFGVIFMLFQYRDLNIIALGERAATHLGMNVERKKTVILIVGSLLTAAAVSSVGIIGFVGLIIPHLMRILVGPDHRILLPASTLAGATFLLWSDTIARTLLSSREIPIGVITAFVGAPFFAYLLKSGLRRG